MTSEEARQTEELHYLDDLTGLHNRRYFREKLLEEKRNADEKGAAFALLMIDLDNFKPVNDLYGHLTGDKVLTEVGRLLKKSLRPSDILCRYAGDEFVAIIPGTTEADVVRLAENITKSLSEASWVDVSGSPIHPVTCSLGYAFYSEAGKDPTSLISWADQALYAAKRRGGNGHCSEKDIPAEPIGRPLVSTPYIVGREKEFSQLRSLLEQVRQEGGMLALVDGEVGVGKTRLMRELRQFFERRGGTALSGGCFVETGSIPYYPFRDAFRRFFEERKKEGLVLLDILPAYSRKELTRILPGLADLRVSELDRAPDSYRLFEAVRLLLQRISAKTESPLLLTIEDIHWSDKASLDLLHYLARNLGEAPVLLCATYRTEEEHRGANLPPFLASMRAERLAEEVHLGALSPESVSAMIYLLYPGVKFPRELHESLYRKTEGNPFFVEELLKTLDPEQMMEGLSRVEPVPVSLKAILGSRMDSLSPETRDVLACSALVGEEFEFEVVCKVLDRPMCDIIDALEEGAKNHIITEVLTGAGDTYKFTHSLMADVLSSGVSQMRSRMWHQQVGATLEEMYSGKPEQVRGRLIHHFERGDDCEKALKYALEAADQAKNDYANEEAIRYYKKARVMTHRLKRETTQEQIKISEGLGDVHLLTGLYDESLAQYAVALDLVEGETNPKELGKLLRRMSSVHHFRGDYEKMIACAEKSHTTCREAGDSEGVAESLVTLGVTHKDRGDNDTALEHFKESLRIQRELGNKRGIADSIRHMADLRARRAEYDESLELYNEALAIRRDIGDRRGVAAILNAIGNAFADEGNYDGALERYNESLLIRQEIGDKSGVAASLTNIGRVHADQDEYDKALGHYEQALAIQTQLGDKPNIAICLNNMGIIHWHRADFSTALDLYERSLSVYRKIGDNRGTAMALHNIGIVHSDRCDYGEALKCYQTSLRIQKEVQDDRNAANTMHNIGTIHSVRGDYGEALKCLEESLEVNRRIANGHGIADCLDVMAGVCTNLGDIDSALERLRECLEISEQLEDRWIRARGLQSMGDLYQSLFCAEQAERYHKQALALMDEMGLESEKLAVLGETGFDRHLLGDDETAHRTLKEALDRSIELGAKEVELLVLEHISEILLSKGDIEAASAQNERVMGVARERGLKRQLTGAKRLKGEMLTLAIERLDEAEKELVESAEIAERIGALPLLWQAEASLGKFYEKKGDTKKASRHLSKAKEVIEQIASKIKDESLRLTHLNSPRIRPLLTPR